MWLVSYICDWQLELDHSNGVLWTLEMLHFSNRANQNRSSTQTGPKYNDYLHIGISARMVESPLENQVYIHSGYAALPISLKFSIIL